MLAVRRRIAPPLPAASNPSNSTTSPGATTSGWSSPAVKRRSCVRRCCAAATRSMDFALSIDSDRSISSTRFVTKWLHRDAKLMTRWSFHLLQSSNELRLGIEDQYLAGVDRDPHAPRRPVVRDTYRVSPG